MTSLPTTKHLARLANPRFLVVFPIFLYQQVKSLVAMASMGFANSANPFGEPPHHSRFQVALEISSAVCKLGGSPPFVLKVHLANLTSKTITIRTHGTIVDVEDALFKNKFEFVNVATGRVVPRYPRRPLPPYDAAVGKSSLLPEYVEIKPDCALTFEKEINGVGPLTSGPLGFSGPISEGTDFWANDHGCRLSEVNQDNTMLAGLAFGQTYEMRAKESEIYIWGYGGKAQIEKWRKAYPYKVPTHLLVGVPEWGGVTFTLVNGPFCEALSASPRSQTSTITLP